MLSDRYYVERTFESLDTFRRRISADLIQSGISEQDASAVELCLYEVIANIIEHEDYKDSSIQIQCSTGVSVICTLEWTAEKFDITQRPLPDLRLHFSQGNKDGLGIYIIHTLMDRLKYRYENGSSIVEMEKKVNRQ